MGNDSQMRGMRETNAYWEEPQTDFGMSRNPGHSKSNSHGGFIDDDR